MAHYLGLVAPLSCFLFKESILLLLWLVHKIDAFEWKRLLIIRMGMAILGLVYAPIAFLAVAYIAVRHIRRRDRSFHRGTAVIGRSLYYFNQPLWNDRRGSSLLF